MSLTRAQIEDALLAAKTEHSRIIDRIIDEYMRDDVEQAQQMMARQMVQAWETMPEDMKRAGKAADPQGYAELEKKIEQARKQIKRR